MALGFSLFDVVSEARDVSGARAQARLRRRDAEVHVLDRPPRAEEPHTPDTFRRLVREVKRVGPVRPRPRPLRAPVAAAPLTDTTRVEANFTLLGGGVRWFYVQGIVAMGIGVLFHLWSRRHDDRSPSLDLRRPLAWPALAALILALMLFAPQGTGPFIYLRF